MSGVSICDELGVVSCEVSGVNMVIKVLLIH